MRNAIFAILSLFLCNFSFAKPLVTPQAGCLDCFNFSAPTILGAENVSPAEVGLIVYDSYFNKFRGYTVGGTWSKLSSESVVRVVTATGSVYAADDLVIANAASGAITLTLPSAATITGKEYVFKKTDSSSNQITIVGAGSETIDGSANRKLSARYESVRLVSDGSNWVDVSQKTNKSPTIQKFTSGTSQTYTTPAGVTYIRVRMIGGGGGGSGTGGGSPGTGGTGVATTFGSSLLVANGGTGGQYRGGSAGGTASLGTGPIGTAVTGGEGSAWSDPAGGTQPLGGATGAATPFGGGGVGGAYNAAGRAPAANTGAGGGGGGSNNVSTSSSGTGGGGGGFIDAVITNPGSTYTYTVGAGGSAGTAGTSGNTGGAGAAGYIEVTEYYQ